MIWMSGGDFGGVKTEHGSGWYLEVAQRCYEVHKVQVRGAAHRGETSLSLSPNDRQKVKRF
jgi:hypothetical protein